MEFFGLIKLYYMILNKGSLQVCLCGQIVSSNSLQTLAAHLFKNKLNSLSTLSNTFDGSIKFLEGVGVGVQRELEGVGQVFKRVIFMFKAVTLVKFEASLTLTENLTLSTHLKYLVYCQIKPFMGCFFIYIYFHHYHAYNTN